MSLKLPGCSGQSQEKKRTNIYGVSFRLLAWLSHQQLCKIGIIGPMSGTQVCLISLPTEETGRRGREPGTGSRTVPAGKMGELS